MTDYDGTTHMSEETHDAAVRGPLAIRLAVAVSGALGFGLNIAFTFCLPLDYSTSVLASPTGLPVAQLFLNAGGPAGGTVMLCFVILVQFFTGCSAMLANARMTYAFARDDALPYSHIWSQVSTRTGTPVKAVWFVVVFCACLNLIGLGSTQTITGIFNVCAPCLDLSYIAVIVAHLYYTHLKPYLARRFPNLTFGKPTSTVIFVPGPYTLPRWRKYPTNIVAVIWVLFISVVLFFPTTKPVTAANMNYAIAIAGVVGLFAVGWWFAGSRNKYVGPRTKDLGVGETGEI
jgi:amino acid transporter